METALRRVGFVGTGIMGTPMAARLTAAGFDVTAWNRTAAKAEPLRGRGVRLAARPADVAEGADAVVCMLSSGPVCDEVLGGLGGVIDTMAHGAALVVMSSIPVATARDQAALAARRGLLYVDAPVSGGEKGAIEGTLAIMAGGEAAVIELLRPLFIPLGRLTHVGPAGTGSLAKLANQAIVATTITAVAEALLLAERAGPTLRRCARRFLEASPTLPSCVSTADAWWRATLFREGRRSIRSRTRRRRSLAPQSWA